MTLRALPPNVLESPEVTPRWGDRVLPEAPGFDAARQTPLAAAGQVGPAPRVLAHLPLTETKTLLALRHGVIAEDGQFDVESGERRSDGVHDERTRARIALAGAGMSLVTVKYGPDGWAALSPRKAPYNRRVSGTTACKVTGPLAGARELRTSSDPTAKRLLGVVGLGSGGLTPWTTVLAGERLLDAPASWALADSRFGDEREANRFGWMVELDPLRPHTRPRKLTMLGRLDHAESSVALGEQGQVLVTMISHSGSWFRFASRHRYDDSPGPLAMSYNRRLLASGSLSVRIPGGGWHRLTTDRSSFVPGLGVHQVLLDLEAAAQAALGAGSDVAAAAG